MSVPAPSQRYNLTLHLRMQKLAVPSASASLRLQDKFLIVLSGFPMLGPSSGTLYRRIDAGVHAFVFSKALRNI